MNFPFSSSSHSQQPGGLETLVIYDLPPECKEPELLQLAQSYGRVKSCEIKRDFRNHDISIYGILHYYSYESAEAAYRSLNGAVYLGKILRAGWLNRNPTPQFPNPATGATTGPGPQKGMKTAQVHISYISKQINFIVTENYLRDIFCSFGPVAEISLKKSSVDPEMFVQNGYGFVHYPLTTEGIESAFAAVQGLHQTTINSITFDCSVSNQLNQILANLRRNNARQMQNRARFPTMSMQQTMHQMQPDPYGNMHPHPVVPMQAPGRLQFHSYIQQQPQPQSSALSFPSVRYEQTARYMSSDVSYEFSGMSIPGRNNHNSNNMQQQPSYSNSFSPQPLTAPSFFPAQQNEFSGQLPAPHMANRHDQYQIGRPPSISIPSAPSLVQGVSSGSSSSRYSDFPQYSSHSDSGKTSGQSDSSDRYQKNWPAVQPVHHDEYSSSFHGFNESPAMTPKESSSSSIVVPLETALSNLNLSLQQSNQPQQQQQQQQQQQRQQKDEEKMNSIANGDGTRLQDEKTEASMVNNEDGETTHKAASPN